VKALAVAVFLALALPAAAGAHASLVRTEPLDGSVLRSSPTAVRIVFDDTVRRGPGIEAIRNGGGSVLAGAARVAGGRTLVVPLRPHLADGDYSVRWAIISDDGHLESGVLAFAVGVGRPPPTAALRAEAAGAQPGAVAARWLFLGGILTAVGIALFALVSGARDEAIALTLTSATVAAALGAADAAHSAGLSTRAGTVFFAASIYGVVLALGAAAATLAPRVLPAALVLVLPLVAAPTLSGHALDRGLPRLNVAADVLHVAGASAWVGALVGLVVTRRRDFRLAVAGVVVLAVSGIVRAFYELLHVAQLWDTNYGRTILVKTGLLLAAAALGLRRRPRVELLLVAGVVVAAAVLVLERPGRNVAARAGAAPPTAAEPGPPPPAPPPDAIVVAREIGVYGVALASEPRRLTATVLSPAGGGADGVSVQIDGHDAASCGHGCYRVDGAHRATARVSVGGLTRAIASPVHAQRASVGPFESFFHGSRSVEYVERLASSPTNAIVTRWRLEAPNRFSYEIRGGAQAVVIGGRRWDRNSPTGRWQESPQTPLPQPAVPWTRATNVWRISPQDIVFVDPSIPAYFDLRGHEELLMTAASHFMVDRYVSFGSTPRLRPPR
jgi:copper transport protein